MKKDKEVRKAEFKAAVIKKIKGLIGPVIALLIIVGIAIAVSNIEEEEEVEEIIEVRAYEGDTSPMVLENSKLKLTLDPTTTQFEVLVKDSGAVWKSVPEGAGAVAGATADMLNMWQSTLLLEYSETSGIDKIYNSFQHSIANQLYNIEQGEDYIKILYSIGETQQVFYVPPVLSEARYNEYLASKDDSLMTYFSTIYKKLDIKNLTNLDKGKESEFLERYPCLEEGIHYVLRDNASKAVMLRLQDILAEQFGYTPEQFAEDSELDTQASGSDKPIFNVNLVLRLDGEDFIAEIPLEEIEYKSDYPLTKITMLPYFGAGSPEDEGYMLIPEGGGAIINFNNGKVTQEGYSADLYGWDMAITRRDVVQETSTSFNVFGLANGNNSYICVLEGGAPFANVSADINGRKANYYNYINATHRVIRREQYDIADKTSANMFVYEPSLPKVTLKNRYRFVNSNSYVDMANNYNQYLTKLYGADFEMMQDSNTPVAVEIVGAVDKITQVVGIPTSRPWKLTSFNQATDIVKTLKDDGFGNMYVKLSGWCNGGVRQKVLNDAKIVSQLGSKKDLKNFIATSKELGVPVFLDAVTNYCYDSDIFDGFIAARDAARFVTDEKCLLYPYSKVTYGQLQGSDKYYLLNPESIAAAVEELTETAKDFGANVSFADIGNDLSSDFNDDGIHTRQMAMEKQIEFAKNVKAQGMEVMVGRGNDYIVPYVDMVTDSDLSGVQYKIIDQLVPFYQIATHGYFNYTGEALNLAQNMQDELLRSAEYGAGLSFTVMGDDAFSLQKTLYTEYFGASFQDWHPKMTEIYTRYNQELGHIYNQRMVNHESLTNKVSCTSYEDGTKVYVNYSFEDYVTPAGKKIPARDYVVVQ